MRVTTTLLGWSRDDDGLVIKTGRTRHGEIAAPTPDEAAAFEAEVQRLVKKGSLAAQREGRDDDTPGTGAATVVVSYWVLEAEKRQVIVVSGKRPGRRLDFGDVLEVRLADWQDKKPGSRPGKVVIWRRGKALVAAAPSEPARDKRGKLKAPAVKAAAGDRVRLVALAAPLRGRPHHAPLGDRRRPVVRDDRQQVALRGRPAGDGRGGDLPLVGILDETAKALGTPLESILVDASIERWVKAGLPKKGPGAKKGSRVWRLLAQVGGHDGHHHVRIAEGSAAQEKKARERLGTARQR